jgi:surface protein
MFYNCSSLTSLDVSNFDTGNVTDMIFMFGYCFSLTSLNLSNFTFTSDPAVTGIFRLTGEVAENKPIPIYVTATGKQYIENKGNSGIINSYAVLIVYDESGFDVPNGENNGDENWKN